MSDHIFVSNGKTSRCAVCSNSRTEHSEEPDGLPDLVQQQKDRIAALQREIDAHANECHPTIERLEAELKQALELVHELRPKHDVYDRVCQQLGVKNDILGHVGRLTAALKLATDALETYATKTTLHSIRSGNYAVFNSPGPELAKAALAEIQRLSSE